MRPNSNDYFQKTFIMEYFIQISRTRVDNAIHLFQRDNEIFLTYQIPQLYKLFARWASDDLALVIIINFTKPLHFTLDQLLGGFV